VAAIPPFDEALLQRICDVLADTSEGLTGSEIGRVLAQLGIEDPNAGATKRHRLFAALANRQRRDGCGNHVAALIHAAMSPVRYVGRSGDFEARRAGLNEILAFGGYGLGEDGKLTRTVAARTLTEAEERAGRLRAELQRRGVHADVLAFCRSELVQNNYFHAVFEATKSVADKIRNRSGLSGDGAELVDQAFGLVKTGMPFLAFNANQTATEISEQRGLMNLMKGMFGAFRNVTAHAPKVSWTVTEQDALDLLTIASFLHRRLDAAVRTPRIA
jgi:uncharacterized protein (TIGR02391 family)